MKYQVLFSLKNNEKVCINVKQKLQQMSLYFFYFYLSKEIRLDVSCESSA